MLDHWVPNDPDLEINEEKKIIFGDPDHKESEKKRLRSLNLDIDSTYLQTNFNSIPAIPPAIARMDHYIVYLYRPSSPLYFNFLSVYFLSL